MSKKSDTPKKYKFKDEYCEMLVEHMGEGYSFESFAGKVGVARSTVYLWAERYKEFGLAKDEAFAVCLAKWEEIGMKGMYMGGKENPFQASIWIFQMKNRFNWRDKVESEVTNRVTLEDLIDDSMNKE